LNGISLFKDDGTIFKLNENAKSASLHLPKDCYSSIEKNKFVFENGVGGKSHLLNPILPKPQPSSIKKMVGEYYADQAKHYDTSDLDNELRYKYVQAVNNILVDEFKKLEPKTVMALACGTGRRAEKIKKTSTLNYKLFGVDISPEMCKIARERGIDVKCGDWLNTDIEDNSFDIITMLYSFGHLPDANERLMYLTKIFIKLRSGGAFYFDVFNIEDEFEWGKNAIDVFKMYNLSYFGYDKGDVFYRRTLGEKIAFLHYFKTESVVSLLTNIGFVVERVNHIGYMNRSGEILEDRNGKIFIKAVKP